MLLLVTQESEEEKMNKFLKKYFSDINAAISEVSTMLATVFLCLTVLL